MGPQALSAVEELSNPANLGVVILNWNGREHLLKCLQSIAAGTLQPRAVIVVDNHSTDGSPDAVSEAFPNTHVIRNSENLGFARANNQGGAAALKRGCELILFLNNDTLVAPDALELMATAARGPRVAIVNPMITDLHDEIWFAGARFRKWSGEVKHDLAPVDSSRGVIDIESATGCALLTRADVVETLGPFDERFFIYYEDSDLSATLRRRGERIVLQPAAIVKHMVHADSRKNAVTGFHYYLGTRNRLLYARRNLSTGRWVLFLAGFTVTFVVPRILALLVTGRVAKAKALARGYVDYFRKQFGPPRL